MSVAPLPLSAPRRRSRRTRQRPRLRRAPWRQWFVEAERGLTSAFRAESIFFVHLFGGCLAVAAGWLFGLTLTGWAVLLLALTIVVAAELFHLALKQLFMVMGPASAPAARLTAAAVAVTTVGAVLAILLVMTGRLWGLFAE